MKLWINFEEEDIKKREKGWSEGDDFEGQLLFEEEQDLINAHFLDNKRTGEIEFHFNNGFISFKKCEIGELFR